MAGIITMGDDQMWAVSNWAYWALMDRVLELVSDDPSVAYFVEQCKWMHGLNIPRMQKDKALIADAVLTALKRAAQECMDGAFKCKVDGRVLDDESQRQFREATGALLAMLLNSNLRR